MDPTLISASDADFSGDSRIVAKSIEGEDDLVDVSMQDAPEKSSTEEVADEYVVSEPPLPLQVRGSAAC